MDLIWLCSFAFLAGFVDSVAGGGGLIQLPALFLFYPAGSGIAISALLGSNKLSSICGTSLAMIQYARSVKVPWHSILPAGIAAFIFSFVGAWAVTKIPNATLRPMVFLLLVAVTVYTVINKNFGDSHEPKFHGVKQTTLAVVTAMGIGFYDGFFGPGTGSFLIFIFIGIFGFDFLTSSASSKVINFATNLSAVIFFAATDNILFHIAVPMGICNALGSVLGSRMAILKGNRFVRIFFILVATAMVLRFGFEVLKSYAP